MLDVRNYSKKYVRSDHYSAINVSFQAIEGEVVGLVGSNGAGKSTIIKSIVGILPFSEGEIQIDDYDLVKDAEEAKRLIGYVPDDYSVYEKLTGREFVNYMGSLYGATKEQKQYTLTVLADTFEIAHALDIQIANYSRGMRQKICTADRRCCPRPCACRKILCGRRRSETPAPEASAKACRNRTRWTAQKFPGRP